MPSQAERRLLAWPLSAVGNRTLARSSLASPSVLAIGAGVIGYACALALLRRGCHVILVDPDREARAASWGNAGHIATEQVEPLASPALLRSAPKRLYAFGGPLSFRSPLAIAPWLWRYLRASTPARFQAGRRALSALMEEALPAWHRLAHELGASALVREQGHWVCWESEASTSRGRATWRATDTGTARFVPFSPAQITQLQHALPGSQFDGIAFHGTAQISDPIALLDALARRFTALGGERRYDRVERLGANREQAQAFTTDGAVLNADRILVCAGIRSGALMATAGERVPLVAERGYHLQWSAHDWPDLPPVVFEDRSIILTRFSSALRLAGFVEYSAVDAPADPGKWRRLQHHAEQLGLPVRGDPSQWFGARPTLPDYLPAIGRSRRTERLYYAFGHQHLGLTLAAASGELIGDLVSGETPSIDLKPFDLERFRIRGD